MAFLFEYSFFMQRIIAFRSLIFLQPQPVQAMPDNALIIFAKNADLGKVKTQLALAIGEKEALSVHKQLLYHTYYISRQLPMDKYVYYAGYIKEDDLWNNDEYYKSLQTGETLGEKMFSAFENLFSFGYSKCILVGSESIEIETIHILQALTALDDNEVVIGPAQNGGYYLLGMSKMVEELFVDKPWGTKTLFKKTLDDLDSQLISYHILPVLSDVDEEKELYLLHHRQ